MQYAKNIRDSKICAKNGMEIAAHNTYLVYAAFWCSENCAAKCWKQKWHKSGAARLGSGFCAIYVVIYLRQYRIILSADTASEVPQLPERCLSRKAGIVRCCLNIVIPFWLLSPLFISSRSSPPSRTGWRRSCRCRWPPWPGTMPRTAPPDGNMPQHPPRSWNTFALGWGMPFADFTHTNNKHRAAMQGGPACGTVLCCIRLLSGYCFFLASCLPTAHSQSIAAAARAGYTIRPNSWYQVGIK